MNKILLILLGIPILFFNGCFQNFFNKNVNDKELSMQQRTLAIIKPDAVKAKSSGKIIDRIEQEGFNILAMQKIHLTKEKAESFYAVHNGKPFFDELVQFMISGPVIVMAMEKEDAIKAWRDLMGATDPAEAAQNTIRKLYGTNKGENATHGSDAPETATQEIKFFFPELD